MPSLWMTSFSHHLTKPKQPLIHSRKLSLVVSELVSLRQNWMLSVLEMMPMYTLTPITRTDARRFVWKMTISEQMTSQMCPLSPNPSPAQILDATKTTVTSLLVSNRKKPMR